ncbi:dihydroorotate dehydrogenase electron transfer subunit [Candidatus Bipolaricaulota bacterium]|nr:dihydroorotate dehydrogenase electron transfer subunit [Candidatus Bipolaricaulota bacterium]
MTGEEQRIREIEEVRRESPTVKTFRVRDHLSAEAEPGQFLMVWLPGSEEVPLAVSGAFGPEFEMTVKNRGATTEKLHQLEAGDELGLRGPFGNGFTRTSDNCLLVGGGYGVAPLRHLYRSLPDETRVSVIAGASTEEELLFLEELNPEFLTTEDGSKGEKGDVVDPVKELLDEKEIGKVYTSGPEKMIHRIFEICKERGLDLEASLERVMKCGVGLCGSCLIDGFRVCQDGPVADLETLSSLVEFGNWERTFSGKREPI